MRAYILTEQGPAMRDAAKAPPKHGQVLVKVAANGLNRIDLAMSTGALHGARGGLGTVLGSEWSGTVEAVGPGVTGFKEGDRVMGASASSFAEYVTVHAAHVLAIPDGMSFEDAACFPVGLRTMHDAIVTVGRFQPGQTVMIQGASSGVGILGLQIAKVLGAKSVIGSSMNTERRAKLADYGCDFAVDSNDDAWPDKVLEHTNSVGVDLIVDQVSGHVVNGNMRATKLEGRIVNVGRLGGTRSEFNADLHALRRIHYLGVTFRTRTLDEIAEINRRADADLAGPLAEGKLKMPIDEIFPFAQVEQAMGKMARNQHFGKIVLKH
ncbi:quinone oxidoreductase family protein [Phenylobacterium sp.]|uniref:quinone oxidoreductase family protein n=1 Tax=Phenylobacterium sp. TaxID=1871053 RepID=UPI002C448E27|nr:zinc-binding dehydrogenase [Phenylobacterium sp.]HLZ75901.1 zinc-binding dehydrogenase [Phenylobacterium sp.]